MRIAVISDCHLGHAYGTVLENDSFENFEEAVNKAIDGGADLIILGGDTFDSKMPRTTVWAKALNILTKPLLRSSNVKLLEIDKPLKEISKRTLQHLPVLALHGNHERRAKGELNIIEALENAGLLIHLNKNTVVFEKDNIKVAISGMSNVPERYSKEELKKWNLEPKKGCFNILILHQNILPFVFSPLEYYSLTLEDLPKGFDLILDGHIHSHFMEKIGTTPFFVIGSTITTQLEKNESLIEKGFLFIDLDDKLRVSFIPLQNNRKFLYDEIEINPNIPLRSQVEDKISQLIYKKQSSKPPLIKLKIFGDERYISEVDLRAVEKKFEGKAIIIFSKELESAEVIEKTELLRGLIEEKLSIDEMGLNLLQKNLEELKFDFSIDFESLFHLLLEDEIERATDILFGEQKTLTAWVRR
ncbi:MAG: DNA repair exonuclease [Candidatus Aenigmatarchaeota archaeon]